MGSCEKERREAEYHSKDFDWEDLRSYVEHDPRLSYHFTKLASPSHSSSEALADSDAWKRFHTRHSSGKFFKERRYLLKEFPELLSCREYSKLLEVGCGSGSTAISILRGNQNIVVYACDCSTEILDRAKQIVEEASSDAGSMLGNRFHPFHCDLSITGFPSWLACNQTCLTMVCDDKHESFASKASKCCVGGVDFVSLIFTLSAIPLKDMPKTIKECFSVLKPGGLLLFRDYGLYDMTMLRFEHDQRVGVREYMRSDGTRSYFFCLDTVRALFSDLGFVVLELDYCCIKSVNRRNGKSLQRVWVHGKFQKPV